MTSDEPADSPGTEADDEAGFIAETAPELADDAVPLELEPNDPVAAARRRHGAAGAIVAAGMLGLEQVLGRKPKQEAPVVVAAPTDPIDVDRDGIAVVVDDEVSIVAPALPRTPPIQSRNKRNKGSARRR